MMKNDLEITQFDCEMVYLSRNKLLERRATAATQAQNPSSNIDKNKGMLYPNQEVQPIQSQSQTNHTDDFKKHQSASKSKSNRGINTTKDVIKQRSDKSELSRYSTNNDPNNNMEKANRIKE